MIRVCQLKREIGEFPEGLHTVIGERGITISGGQRARISLARACYSQADIFLLDDPLSAVDPEVGDKIFRECLRDYLRDKAILLVTHEVKFLNQVDEVIVLEGGEQRY